MLGWTLILMATALVVGCFAFGSGQSTALTAGMAKALFFVFAALALLSLLSGGAFGL